MIQNHMSQFQVSKEKLRNFENKDAKPYYIFEDIFDVVEELGQGSFAHALKVKLKNPKYTIEDGHIRENKRQNPAQNPEDKQFYVAKLFVKETPRCNYDIEKECLLAWQGHENIVKLYDIRIKNRKG